MSSATAQGTGVASGNSVSGAVAPAPKTFAQMAIRQTLGNWGARLGLVWLSVLAFFAVFGPLLANSHPIYVKYADGVVAHPMWRSLTSMDLGLLAGTLGGLVAVGLWRLGLRKRVGLGGGWGLLGVFGVMFAVGFGVGYLKGTPPNVVYESWREAEREGRATAVVRTLIVYSPNDRNRDVPDAREKMPTWAAKTDADRPTDPAGPVKSFFVLGTDRDGSDLASRMIYASRTALAIGFVATGIATVIGVVIGGLMGYFAGWFDILGMRVIEIFEAVPRLMLLLAVASIFDADIMLMMVMIGLTGWMGNARFIRAEFLRLRNQDFVQAAQALGLPLRSIIFRHMLPNGVTPVLVSVSFGVAGAILIESTLAFLGIGKADQPSWGQLLNQARTGGEFQWWIAIFPGLMIFLTVFSYQLIGEALRDALDPKLKKRE